MLTSGVKRNFIPSREPFRVSPLIRKIVRTTYGRVEVMYTACGRKFTKLPSKTGWNPNKKQSAWDGWCLLRPCRWFRCRGCSRRKARSRRPPGRGPSTTADLRTRRWSWTCSGSLCTKNNRQCCCAHTPPPDLRGGDTDPEVILFTQQFCF